MTKTANFGLIKPTHGINVVEGNTAGVPNEALNLDAIDAVLTSLGAPTGAAAPTYTTSGAISQKSGVVGLGSAGVLTMTLADPGASDDGKVLKILAVTAHAHIVTTTAAINGGSNHKATFGGALGDQLNLIAFGSKWYQLPSTNITLAAS